MSVVFLIGENEHELPQASQFDVSYDYTSTPLRMANGRTVWQAFPVEGDEDPSWIYHYRIVWAALTETQRTTITTVYAHMREGTACTMTAPDGASYDVKIDPDAPQLEMSGFAVASVMRYRTTLNLISDEA